MADLHRDPIAIVLAAINGYTAQDGGSGSGATTVIVGGTGLLFLPVTRRDPRSIFDYIEGVIRWHDRVIGYAFVLVTDVYPPFRLAP